MIYKRKTMIAKLCGCFLLFGTTWAGAQNIQVRATIDSTSILVGQQTRIRLELAQDKSNAVSLILPADTLLKGIEILDVSAADTATLSDSRIQINQNILVTSFDSGFYYVPPFKYVAGADTFSTNSLSLKVVPFEVDTTAAEFDIKTVMAPPFVWKDYLSIILLSLLIPLAVLAGLLIYRRYKNKKPLLNLNKEKPKLPVHVRAIAALEELKQQKLWQNGREKEYYTDITDILREYIEERFHINAKEMTSDEILSAIKETSDANSVYNSLRQILQTADYVKFAKMRPLPDDNELSMINSVLFVNQTKEEEIIPVGEKPAGENEPEKETK